MSSVNSGLLVNWLTLNWLIFDIYYSTIQIMEKFDLNLTCWQFATFGFTVIEVHSSNRMVQKIGAKLICLLQICLLEEKTKMLAHSSRFHEGLMFPKHSEIFGKFRNLLVDFSILYRIWGQKYHVTDKNKPKIAVLDRNHLSKLYKRANYRRNLPKLSEYFGMFRKPQSFVKKANLTYSFPVSWKLGHL